MYRIEMNSGDDRWVGNLDSYTKKIDEILNVSLRSKYYLQPVGSRSVLIEGNIIPLGSVGVKISAGKLASFWSYIDVDYDSVLSQIAATALAMQAQRYATSGIMSGIPLITPVVKLAGFIRYFYEYHPTGMRAKFEEILTEQLQNQRGYELLQSTGSFASELWLAHNIFECGHDLKFKTEGNQDIIIDDDVSVEVTRKCPDYDMQNISMKRQDVPQIDIDDTTVSLPDILSSALRHARMNIEDKKKRGSSSPDMVAIDITGRLPGSELAGMANIFDAGLFELDRQLVRASRLAQSEEPAILFYTSPHQPKRDIKSIALPYNPDTTSFPFGYRTIQKKKLGESDLSLNYRDIKK
jgi:hypothetical protein